MTISLPYAPTAMNSSLTDTACPNQSPAAPSDAVSFAEADVLLHPVSGSVNTYAAPNPSPFSFPGAPTSTVLPLAETEYPNRSPDAPSDAVSFAEADVSAQPVSGFVKTYATPAPPPPGVPTTMVSPDTETACPNRLPAVLPDAVSFAGADISAHPVSGLVYAYAAPAPGAPTTIVVPSVATEYPYRPSAGASGIVSLAMLEMLYLRSHPSSGLMNTYAAPGSFPLSVPGAPTTIVSSPTAAEVPNLPPGTAAGASSETLL